MKTQKYIICGQDIGLYGWSKHVASEKRKHGDDVYVLYRRLKVVPMKNHRLTDFEERPGRAGGKNV